MIKGLSVRLGFVIICCTLTGCFHFPPPASLRLAADPDRLRQGPPPPADTVTSSPLVLDPVRIEPEQSKGFSALPTSVTMIYDRAPVPLSLADVVLYDLANNRQIKISRFDARIAQYGLPVAMGIYDLLLTGNLSATRNERQTGQPPNLTVSRSRPRSGEVAASQLLPTGATISVDYQANRPAINSYNNQTTIQLRQPLLQGLGWAVTNANIEIAALNREGNEAEFLTVAEDQLTDALNAYWDLIGYIQALRVEQVSYAAAADLNRVNKARYDVGLISIADLLQTEASAAARYDEIIRFRQLVRDTEDQLKRLLVLDGTQNADKPAWPAQFLPTQPIAWREITVNLDASVDRALKLRPEVIASRTQVDAARQRLKVAHNNLLPVLDFVGSLIPNGVSQGTRDGGFDEAFGNMVGDGAVSYILGLQFSYPLQNRAARYRHRQSQALLAQAGERFKDVQDQVTQEVRSAARQYASARQQIDVSQSQILSQQTNLDTERLRLEVGLSTTFRVLQFQQDLATAQLQHIQAVIATNKAAISLERAQGTLLETYGVKEAGEIPSVPVRK